MRPIRILSYYVPVMTVVGYVFLFAPLVVLVLYAFNAGRSTVIWEGFSLDWFAQALNDRGLKAGLRVSAIVAVLSALIATAIGTSAALAVVKRSFPGKNLFSTLVTAPLVLPEIVLAVGLLVATVWTGVPLGYGTLIAGHVLVSVPFSFLIVRAAAAGLDPRLDEAAADLGANGGQVFMRVTLPLLLPAILSALLLCAVISFDNFVISTFVSGVGTTPLPIQIYAMLKTGLTPKINALGTMLIAVNILAILLVLSRYIKTVRTSR
ncbi:ABC transporter permease [Rhizobium sp. CG5]|uniref:ABC transporter permease n=1 Tax=Rhizobium sp. CG5 TaxID=2726076 RepID=UPI0020345F91|nr:ABC transporter permease [Rhizobium sp. CG5]MCM2474238.1 ABC transporter permease [Rhizobium sp. CG5]